MTGKQWVRIPQTCPRCGLDGGRHDGSVAHLGSEVGPNIEPCIPRCHGCDTCDLVVDPDAVSTVPDDAGNSDASFIIVVLLGLVVAGALLDNGLPFVMDLFDTGWRWAWSGIVTGSQWAAARLGV